MNEELASWMRVNVFVCIILIELAVYVCIWRWIGYSLLCVFSSLLPHDGSMIQSLYFCCQHCLSFPTSLEDCSINNRAIFILCPKLSWRLSSPPSLARGSVVQCPVYILSTSATLLIKLENVGEEKDSDMS